MIDNRERSGPHAKVLYSPRSCCHPREANSGAVNFNIGDSTVIQFQQCLEFEVVLSMGIIAFVSILAGSVFHEVAAQLRLNLGLAKWITSKILRGRRLITISTIAPTLWLRL